MRPLIAVLCFVALASADKLGYNYQPVGHSNSGLSFTPGTAASNESPAFAAPQASHASQGDFGSVGPVAEQSAAAPQYAAQPELEKEFFTYSANDDDFLNPAASEQAASSLKKGLRVVFVKGPEHSGLEEAALALAKQAAQQETAIYVLNKQADIGDLANKLNQIHGNNNNKPEVHFVKYRTPEDAANAQQAIQSQYDQLGGSSTHQNGGTAPVLNFASSAPAPVAAEASAPAPVQVPTASNVHHEEAASAPTSSYVPPVPENTYLPAHILRLFRI